ncbi:MAG TPA: hypothetical protein VKA51_05455 [Rubrobacteraceae bacterium]|nr:hypothetical protein [Rubrobacteraceae bacterium]
MSKENGADRRPRGGYFGHPESAKVAFLDEDGNRLTEQEFRERMKRKAEVPRPPRGARP